VTSNSRISAIMATYNGEDTIGDCLRLLLGQDYPIDNIELIIADGGSTDETLNIIKQYQNKHPNVIQLINNPEKSKVGKGKGADVASRKATGDLILMIDQDNLLIQKNWLKEMVRILEDNDSIVSVQSLTSVPEEGSIMDKYLGAVGTEDPFSVVFSLKSQVILHPHKFHYNESGKYFTYNPDRNNYYYAGDNGFLMRRKAFVENGGYTQDTDNFYRMALSNNSYTVAIPTELFIFHKTSSKLFEFIKKRGYYARYYLRANIKDRDVNWISFRKNTFKHNVSLIGSVVSSLVILPRLYEGIRMAMRTKETAWLIHPIVSFALTLNYICSFVAVRVFKVGVCAPADDKCAGRNGRAGE